MTLELNRLTVSADEMGAAIVRRQAELNARAADARERLRSQATVTPELRTKIERARQTDAWRRGAVPLSDRLDETTVVRMDVPQAVLIAADGSQIFPDRDAAALYYVINVGSIIFRVGSGAAPTVATRPQLYYEEADIYNANRQLRSDEEIGAERNRREMESLVKLAEAERAALGGDISVPIVALTDGPLLPWLGAGDTPESVLNEEMDFFAEQMERLRKVRAIPVGYTDRPRSAYVLRILELVTMQLEDITRDSLRQGLYISLSDRQLFSDLAPNARSGLFVPTTEANDRYGRCSEARTGQRDFIAFCYANMARQGRGDGSIIARLEVPGWVANDPNMLSIAQAVVAANCEPLPYPYVLARAHELAVVTEDEKGAFNEFLNQIMWRNGLTPEMSTKSQYKTLTSARRRR